MTIDEGKSFFFLMKGSSFAMAREEQLQYQSYLALGISKETENLWRQELLGKYYKDIQMLNPDNKLWIMFNDMYELTINIRNIGSLSVMENSLKAVKPKLNDLERIIVAETVNGRGHQSTRSGLIYLSFDLNDKWKASFFANMSLELLNIRTEDIDLLNRVASAKLLCQEIVMELGI